MSLRKYGTGEILPEEDTLQKQATQTPQDKDQVLAEVQAEALDADHEDE